VIAAPATLATWRRPPWPALAGVLLAALVWQGLALPPAAAAMAGVTTWMAAWWLTEAAPIPVTSLLPLVLLPAAGLGRLDDVAASYGDPVIYLFLGGFMLALALEQVGLHRRVALWILDRVGDRPRRLVFGFMLTTALGSMWISNTAMTMVMLPIASSVLGARAAPGAGPDRRARLDLAVLLGVAWAASIGGLATLVGTAPNLVLVAQLQHLYPERPPIGFAQWMLIGLPTAALLLVAGWALLVGPVGRLPASGLGVDLHALRQERAALGPLGRDERWVAGVFVTVALAWVTGADLRLGDGLRLPGWRGLLGLPDVGDAAVAVAGAIALFLVPSRARPGEALLTWRVTSAVPWGLLLLFGGGFALAEGFGRSGLSAEIGAGLRGLAGVPGWVAVASVSATLNALTELTSNTATTTLVLPILARVAEAMAVDPLSLMVPATLSASCAFMLPVGTPPMAIVFGTGRMTMGEMARAGLWMNALAVAVVLLVFRGLGGWVFGLDW
jgi:sodium-dependent dicarboxylate transporter 2/3/5